MSNLSVGTISSFRVKGRLSKQELLVALDGIDDSCMIEVEDIHGNQLSTETPKEQGLYWHWSGDRTESPIVLQVLWSGSEKACFVSAGQYGLKKAVFCDLYGGYWSKAIAPLLPGE